MSVANACKATRPTKPGELFERRHDRGECAGASSRYCDKNERDFKRFDVSFPAANVPKDASLKLLKATAISGRIGIPPARWLAKSSRKLPHRRLCRFPSEEGTQITVCIRRI